MHIIGVMTGTAISFRAGSSPCAWKIMTESTCTWKTCMYYTEYRPVFGKTDENTHPDQCWKLGKILIGQTRSEPYFWLSFGHLWSVFFYSLVLSNWFSFILTGKNRQTGANFQHYSGTGLLESYQLINIAVQFWQKSFSGVFQKYSGISIFFTSLFFCPVLHKGS